MPTAQARPRTCEPLAERRTEAVTSIRQHATEADTGRDYAIDLRQGDLWFCPCNSTFDRNAGSLQPHPIADPTLGETPDPATKMAAILRGTGMLFRALTNVLPAVL
jgi:hypothetical protein